MKISANSTKLGALALLLLAAQIAGCDESLFPTDGGFEADAASGSDAGRFPADGGSPLADAGPILADAASATDGGGTGCMVDGVHYAAGASVPSSDGCNSCGCSADGQVACTLRACLDVTCGGLEGKGCPAEQFCRYPVEAACGAADQTGTCTAMPEVCTDELSPVCGCDGKTYATACVAASKGVSVAAVGECSSSVCGGLLGRTCEGNTYCNFPSATRCGSGDQTGSCESKPEVCNKLYAPVCGCDGSTYSNACMAASAGISVAATGACGSTTTLQVGDSCGGFGPANAPTCAAGLFCQHQPGALCGAADAPGKCVTVPKSCPNVRAPVCGCDGTTYPSACHASLAQAGILDKGACK